MTDLPREVRMEAERLTRLARRAVDENEAAAYERDRDERLAAFDYTARVRAEDDTLVLHPAEWVEGDTAQLDRIEDTDRAVEISLSGSGDPAEWESVEHHNAAVVDRVRERFPETEVVAKRERSHPIESGDLPDQAVLAELTDRQREALEIAYRAGYFGWPRDSSAEEVADTMDISAATFHGHLRKAQKHLLEDVFEAGDGN